MNLTTKHSDLITWFQLEFPELVQSMKDANHHYDSENLNAYHLEGDVWTHTNMVFKNSEIFSPENNYVKWSTLLHDIGKPTAREVVEERKRVRFIGHEGISAFMAVDILNKTDISVTDKLFIFKLVSLHGDLFHHIKADGTIKSDVLDRFKGERELLENLTHQVRADSLGRWYKAEELSNELFTNELPSHFKPMTDQLAYKILKMNNTPRKPQLTVLVGAPCSRKSTWIEANVDKNTTVVISRDALVEKVGANRGMNYGEAFKFLNANPEIEKIEVAEVLNKTIIDARNNGKDVVVDMTNMSKKTRRRWINEYSKYDKKCITFISGFEALKACNKTRSAETGKNIPDFVLIDMMKRFSLPMYGEGFDELEFIWNE